MANGHSPNKPPGQGDFGPVYTSKPKTSTNKQGPSPASTVKKGFAPKGVGGSKKS
jgi:hypothetical protein